MGRTGQRSGANYERLIHLDAPGFAWEFLRRNPDFQKEREQLRRDADRGVLKPDALEAFSTRWGLRFRGWGRQGRSIRRGLDAQGFAHRGRDHSLAI